MYTQFITYIFEFVTGGYDGDTESFVASMQLDFLLIQRDGFKGMVVAEANDALDSFEGF